MGLVKYGKSIKSILESFTARNLFLMGLWASCLRWVVNIIHEYYHVAAHKIYGDEASVIFTCGGFNGHIHFESMNFHPLFNGFAGGLGTAAILFLLLIVAKKWDWWFKLPVIVLFIWQLVYGIYEGINLGMLQ